MYIYRPRTGEDWRQLEMTRSTDWATLLHDRDFTPHPPHPSSHRANTHTHMHTRTRMHIRPLTSPSRPPTSDSMRYRMLTPASRRQSGDAPVRDSTVNAVCISALTHCNTLQHTAAHCNTLQHPATPCNMLQHPATCCNTLQHAATPCNMLQRTSVRLNNECCMYICFDTLQHTSTHCNTLVRDSTVSAACISAPTHCKISQHSATHCNTLQHTAAHCYTLQHTATHRCGTQQ